MFISKYLILAVIRRERLGLTLDCFHCFHCKQMFSMLINKI